MSTSNVVDGPAKPDVETSPLPDSAAIKGGEANVAEDVGNSPVEDLIDIRTMLSQVIRKWWLMLLFLAVGAWSGVTTIQNHQSAHKAMMIVAPADIQERAAPSSRSIAGIAGLSFNTTSKNDIFQRMDIIAGTLKLAKKLNEEHDLMMVVYGGLWDEEKQSWRRPTGDQFEWDQKMKSFFRQPLWSEPTIEDLANYIGGGFKIEAIDESDFHRISFTHADPDLAVWYLKIVFGEITKFIHEQEVAAQAQRRKFLESRLHQTQIVEFQNSLHSLLASVTRKEMMMGGDAPGEIIVLDPPYLSKYKTSPTILKTLGIRILGALAISIVVIVLWTLYRAE